MTWRNLGRVPPVKAVMTPFPFSVAASASAAEAERTMLEHDIRHLPVMDGHRLVGVLSDRDVVRERASSTSEPGRPVGELLRGEPLVVDSNARLDGVLLEMAERHAQAALVTHEGRLAGILTATDACRILAQALRALEPPPGGNEAA